MEDQKKVYGMLISYNIHFFPDKYINIDDFPDC